MKKPELLAPAGSLSKLKLVLNLGADAVYFGDNNFSLRAKAGNFSHDEIKEGIDYAHKLGKKAYITVNIFARNSDFSNLSKYLLFLCKAKADALIISDPGILNVCRKTIPKMPIFLSTQANTMNFEAVKFWRDCGVKRIILARELSYSELVGIRKLKDIELEVFIHGAICISYSGRCLLSHYLTGRESNRGECSHPCRWEYFLYEKGREGEFYPISEDKKGTYIMNAKDICLLDSIPKLIDLGIDSFKIEGRMKNEAYLTSVVSTYRKAVDDYVKNPKKFKIKKQWREELNKIFNRDYHDGWLGKRDDVAVINRNNEKGKITQEFVAIVLDSKDGKTLLTVKNKIFAGEMLFAFDGKETKKFKLNKMFGWDGRELKFAQPNSVIRIKGELKKDTIIRRKI